MHATVDASIPSYQPQPAAPRKGAGYVLRDGSIQIVGFDDMDGILASLNALFVQSHPGARFKMDLKGNSSAMAALTFDTTAFAPMGTEFTIIGAVPQVKIAGAQPLGIRVAHGSLNPKAKLSPLAVIVNKANPLETLTVRQVAGIFSTGGVKGDITPWGQLGVKGELVRQAINPYGLPEDSYDRSENREFGEFMSMRKMDGNPFTPSYHAMLGYADVVKRVSEDPAAIGIVALNRVSSAVKLVAVVGNGRRTASRGTAEDIVAGKYPYDRYLYIYVRRVAGEPIDPFVKEYLRLTLSRQGQQAIGADAHGYLPLNAREVAEELAKLEE